MKNHKVVKRMTNLGWTWSVKIPQEIGYISSAPYVDFETRAEARAYAAKAEGGK